MSYINLLANVEVFEGLTEKQIKKINAICVERNYDAEQIVFEENSPSKEMYIVVKGKVEIQLDPDLILKGNNKDNPPQTITTLGSQQSFGEIALVDEGVRSASAKIGKKTATLLRISRQELMTLMQEDMDMGFKIMKNLAADLCFKIRNTNLKVREALLYS